MKPTIYDYMTYVTFENINYDWLEEYERVPAIIDNVCQRCKSKVKANYCTQCSEMGKLSKNDYLFRLKGPIPTIKYEDSLDNLELTELQKEASDFIINNIKNKTNCLIWAVCGAGKTEITFNAIEYILQQQKRVCFCIPRVDILYEIADRLRLFFPNTTVSIISGEIKEKEDTQIFVMTTNQLLRYKGVFDLVIVDEVDAFPFSYHPKFMNGVFDALTYNGVFCCLTSTPSADIKKLNLNTFIIYQRWHGYLLPVPKSHLIHNNILFYRLIFYRHFKSIKRQQLIFLCNKKSTILLKKFLTKKYPNYNVENVYSGHNQRKDIIKKFYEQKIDILITTPILERGVTFKDIDVIVLDADNQLYNEASLVQMAGRCRRNPNFQNGNVYFYYYQKTNEIRCAIGQIRDMNQKAKKNVTNK